MSFEIILLVIFVCGMHYVMKVDRDSLQMMSKVLALEGLGTSETEFVGSNSRLLLPTSPIPLFFFFFLVVRFTSLK